VSRPRSSRARTTQVFKSLKRSVTTFSSKFDTSPALKELGGSDSTLGKRKRTVPMTMPSTEAVRATQATLIQEPNSANRKNRRDLPVLAGGLGGAGLGGRAGLGAPGAMAVAVVPSARGALGGVGVGSDMIEQVPRAIGSGRFHVRRFSCEAAPVNTCAV
jgi:hypothetical protein